MGGERVEFAGTSVPMRLSLTRSFPCSCRAFTAILAIRTESHVTISNCAATKWIPSTDPEPQTIRLP